MQVHDFIRDTLTRRIPEHWHVCIEDDFVSQSKSTLFQSLWIQVASGEVFGLSPSQDAILRRAVKPDFHCFQAVLRMFAALLIELDDGKILTGKPNPFDGKNPWVSG